MLGKPKYKYGDVVTFDCEGKIQTGSIAIIDAYGTFFYTEDVSYDIMGTRNGRRCLYKHIPEPLVIERIGCGENPLGYE